jgi:aryl-alcohol dehydrogenase-like predicted oxidoreductase
MPSSAPPAAAAGEITLGGDLTVRRMGFGAMRLTGSGIWGEPADLEAAKGVLRRAVELGVNLIDTADSYGPEVSERLIGEVLAPYSDDLVVATKGGLTRSGPGRWHADCRPEHLKQACEGSLRRLRLDRIDVYQLHTVDRQVPLAESVGALAELREEGKIRHVGLSNVNVDQLAEARSIVPVVSVQNRYSLADRKHEPVLEACERDGRAFLPWFPLAAGDAAHAGGALERVAAARDASPVQLALAWLLARSPVMLPIPGTSSVEHLEENVAAAALELEDSELDALAA